MLSRRALCSLLVLFLALPRAFGGEPLSFRVTFDASLQPGPYTGRVYVALATRTRGEPRTQMGSWFSPSPFFSHDFKDVPPGGTVTISTGALAFPHPLHETPDGTYQAQAIARRSLDSPSPGEGEGDLYSEVMTVVVKSGQVDAVPEFRLSQVAHETAFEETDRVKLFEMQSPALTKFHGRPMTLRAGVVLPEGWTDDPKKSWPVVWLVTGFGGSHKSATRMAGRAPHAEIEPIIVVPDATNFRGHSVFADSANTGPWGEALVRELIPAVEKRYHGAGPAHRYVTGGSSGGWASLWLQITYPGDFRACFSHVPDPVDFRDFQRINLYRAGENMYTDPSGSRRPLARSGDQVSIWYDNFCRMERVMGPGGQIHSFEAVFSPRGPDGQPLPIFDRDTGAVDTAAAKHWEKYDIRLILERNWPTLGPRLAGKLHIYAGEFDTFYLEGAARLLKESLEKLGSDAEVVIVPGMAHSMHTPGNEAMYRQIAEDWRASGLAPPASAPGSP